MGLFTETLQKTLTGSYKHKKNIHALCITRKYGLIAFPHLPSLCLSCLALHLPFVARHNFTRADTYVLSPPFATIRRFYKQLPCRASILRFPSAVYLIRKEI